MPSALITGGAGFFGSILKQRLLAEGWQCVSIDLLRDDQERAGLENIQGDIRDAATLDAILSRKKFDVVFHCAAIRFTSSGESADVLGIPLMRSSSAPSRAGYPPPVEI